MLYAYFENPLFGELVMSNFDHSNLKKKERLASADIALVWFELLGGMPG